MSIKIKKNDTVKVLYGKDAGKTGKVVKVLPIEKKVIVEGLNVYKRHVKGDGRQKQSEIVDLIKPIYIAKVMIVCPLCKKATRIGSKVEDKKRARICKKCNKNIDKVQETKTKKTDVKKNKK